MAANWVGVKYGCLYLLMMLMITNVLGGERLFVCLAEMDAETKQVTSFQPLDTFSASYDKI